MPNYGRLYRPAIETATQVAFKKALLDYFKEYEKLLNNQSANACKLARKKLQRIINMARKRRIELLELYSDHANNNHKQCFSTFSKSNTKEEKDNANQ
jgi:hypothetical protein